MSFSEQQKKIIASIKIQLLGEFKHLRKRRSEKREERVKRKKKQTMRERKRGKREGKLALKKR